jgi:hypothetical protein
LRPTFLRRAPCSSNTSLVRDAYKVLGYLPRPPRHLSCRNSRPRWLILRYSASRSEKRKQCVRLQSLQRSGIPAVLRAPDLNRPVSIDCKYRGTCTDWWGRRMTMVEEYRTRAEECRALAQRPSYDRAQLLKFAAILDKLAHEQERPVSRSYAPLWLRRASAWLSP